MLCDLCFILQGWKKLSTMTQKVPWCFFQVETSMGFFRSSACWLDDPEKKHNIYLDDNNNNNNNNNDIFNDTIKNSSILQHFMSSKKRVLVLPQFSSRFQLLKPPKTRNEKAPQPLLPCPWGETAVQAGWKCSPGGFVSTCWIHLIHRFRIAKPPAFSKIANATWEYLLTKITHEFQLNTMDFMNKK